MSTPIEQNTTELEELVAMAESLPHISAKVERTTTGAVITITDANGTTTAGIDDGKTPVKGKDYYTDADKAEIESWIATELAKRGQLKPEFANSIEECTDTTKMYVLPDGMIYAYVLTEREVETGGGYTNVLPLAINSDGTAYVGTNGEKGYKTGYRISSSGTEKTSTVNCCSGFIACKAGDIIRLKNIATEASGYSVAYFFASAFTKTTGTIELYGSTFVQDDNGVYSFVIPNHTDIAYTRLTVGSFTDDTIITVNEEIVEGGTKIVEEYAWTSTGHAFVPADYENKIAALEGDVETLKKTMDSIGFGVNGLMFISPDGDDNNDGLTTSTPKKTVKACVNAGATKISAKRGVYKEIVYLSDIGELEIFPTDNDLIYAVGAEREPIVFDTSDRIAPSSLVTYNSIKRVAYSNASNTQFSKVFTKQSLTPIVGTGYGSRYNATIWLLSEDEKTVCIKLKPVLTVSECESETNTFTYVDGYIYINANMTSVAKIIIPTNWECGLYFNGFSSVVLKEVEVRFAGSYNIDLRNCAFFDLYKCACKYTSYGSGFHPFNSNGIMTACYATKNYDGYGISGYGHTTYVDCVSEFNFDDGMSHHDGTSGTVIGGRYEGNGKGGNTPAYGAKVNIYGGLYKDNASFGIGYLWTTDLEPASGMVQGAVMVDNPIGLSVQKNCDVIALNCVYKDNASDKEFKGNVTEC